MSYFINQVINDIIKKHKDFKSLVFIFPNHRSAYVFKKKFEEHLFKSSIWMPKIYTIQELMQQISNLSLIKTFSLWIDLYIILYKQINIQVESFNKFIQWVPKTLNDFNEIDIYLIEIKKFFKYSILAESMSQWEPQNLTDNTFFIEKKNLFWEKLFYCYTKLYPILLKKGEGYHGLIFRTALEYLDSFLEKNPNLNKFFFIGMNILSKSEIILIERLLEKGKAYTYWDIDKYYYNNKNQEAGSFIRSYFKNSLIFKNQSIQWINENFKKNKKIEVIGAAGIVGQVKLVGSLLVDLIKQGKNFSKTAIVLSDNRLLIPLLHVIPKEIKNINIDISFLLKYSPLSSSLFIIFNLFSNREKFNQNAFYYKDFFELFNNLYFKELLQNLNEISIIIEKNINFISDDLIKNIIKNKILLKILDISNKDPNNFLNMLSYLYQKFKEITFKKIKKHNYNIIDLKFLDHFNFWIKEISSLLKKHPKCIINIRSLFLVYKEWLQVEKIQLFSNNFNGLFLIGFFETLLLDFDRVIITSVNEGILPPEKNLKSWIPFDIRKQFNLPTYEKKDILYAYHFYRLLQRVKTAFLIYDIESNLYSSGEKSRFINQLDIESNHKINYSIVSFKSIQKKKTPIIIEKNSSIIFQLRQIALKGFSPSSINLYIKNPLEFYKQKILKLENYKINKEYFNSNYIGIIVHEILDILYRSFQGQNLTIKILEKIRAVYSKIIENSFKEKKIHYHTGKNLLLYHIVKNYIEKLITLDETSIKKGHQIIIQGIEYALSTSLKNKSNQIRLYGLIDRVDIYDGLLRIIDYKTVLIKDRDLKIESINFKKVIESTTHNNKILQLLIYSYLWFSFNKEIKIIYPGIISFRRIKKGLILLNIDGNKSISIEMIKEFIPILSNKLDEILNPKIPFIENIEKVKYSIF